MKFINEYLVNKEEAHGFNGNLSNRDYTPILSEGLISGYG